MTSDHVLLVTASYDFAAEYVARELSNLGQPFFRLNTDEFPEAVQVTLLPGAPPAFESNGHTISGNSLKSVWYRRHVSPSLPPELELGHKDFCERESRACLNGALRTISTNRWLSRPDAIYAAECKPYQLALANEAGLPTPSTIVTNRPEIVRDFARGRRVIAKAVSSGYIRGETGLQAIFTSQVKAADLDDLSGLGLAPVIFQELIEKRSDIRVTVVGESVFAAEILSQDDSSSSLDWRATKDPNLSHRRHDLPQEIVAACFKMLQLLGLSFGAFDFALTPNGEYVFFEVNPNGEWVWIEDLLEYPIASSIAAWLAS
jgi:hypothetical protein